MTLADEGWALVSTGTRDGYTWQLWCDTRRPAIADLAEPEPWPQDGEFLSLTFEVADGDGLHMSTSSYGMRDSQKVGHFTAWKSGFKRFVGVRFDEDLEGVTIETTRREITVNGADHGAYAGLRFHVFPLDDGEDLVAITGGETRIEPRLAVAAGEVVGSGYTPY